MTRINGHEVIFLETFIVPDETDALVEFQKDIWNVKIFVRFVLAEGSERTIGGHVDGDGFRFTFKNWKEPFGATISPMKFASSSTGGGLFARFFCQRLGNLNHVTFQIHEEVGNG
jgi:hypothetical protein